MFFCVICSVFSSSVCESCLNRIQLWVFRLSTITADVMLCLVQRRRQYADRLPPVYSQDFTCVTLWKEGFWQKHSWLNASLQNTNLWLNDVTSWRELSCDVLAVIGSLHVLGDRGISWHLSHCGGGNAAGIMAPQRSPATEDPSLWAPAHSTHWLRKHEESRSALWQWAPSLEKGFVSVQTCAF